MGIIDSFAAEDRVNVKFSDIYSLLKSSAASELRQNAVKCDVPHRYIREMISGERENEEIVVEVDDDEDQT